MRKLSVIAFMLPAVLAGCDWRAWRQLPPQAPAAQRGADLKVGVGYSSSADPAAGARQAICAAIASIGQVGPDLVLVWDNWDSADNAQRGLAELRDFVPTETIFGGHVARAVAATRPEPTVTVVVLAGGWTVDTGHSRMASARPAVAADELARAMRLDEPLNAADAGQLLLLFGELPGPAADRFVARLAGVVDRRVTIFGGGGGGQGGSGWQYVAGQVATDTAVAIRLAGPFRVAATRVAVDPKSGPTELAEAATLAVGLLAGELGEHATPAWLLLLSASAGWPVSLDACSLARRSADRLGAGARVAGWAGQSQIAPDSRDDQPAVGQFDLGLALLCPTATASAR